MFKLVIFVGGIHYLSKSNLTYAQAMTEIRKHQYLPITYSLIQL